MRWIGWSGWSGLSVGLVLVFAGCGDEPAPEPNLPTIESAKAQCRRVEGNYKLDLVEVTVRDLDGLEDLEAPVVYVESQALTMNATPQAPSEDCDADACDVLYTWEHSRDSDQLYCGEDGKLLIVDFSVRDLDGFIAEDSIKTVPL